MRFAAPSKKAEATAPVSAAKSAGSDLRIGEPDDSLEQEADRVAEEIAAGGRLQRSLARAGAGAPLQRKCGCGGAEECDKCREEKTLRRKADGTGKAGYAPPIVQEVLNSPGEPLDAATRSSMETRFGYEFSKVRVHHDSPAADSAKAVGARAYTVRQHIVFARGQYGPGTQEGDRLLAHELTHVRQQSTSQTTRAVVQRQPAKDEWSQFESTYDPRFIFWAKRHRKPPANFGELNTLLEEYAKVADTKEVLEEYDSAQAQGDRSALEKRRQTARAAEVHAEQSKSDLRQKEREREQQLNKSQLNRSIRKALSERWRFESSESARQAQYDTGHLVRLQVALGRQHWKSAEHRWIYIYYYLREYYGTTGSSVDEGDLALYVAQQEEIYLEGTAREAEAAELALNRKGLSQKARSAQIRELAASRPMNPLENFDPGIHDYQPYAGQPQSVDADIVDGDFDESVLTIVYSDGKTLEIPLNANPDLFSSKPLDPQKVLRKFNRRHKSSGRLIPFVIYENTSGVSDLDLLSEEDLALMGLPRFDPELTPHVMYFLSPDFKMKKLSMATLQLAAGMANPFPCTEVDEQGNLNASFSFSNCALPLLLKAHAAHSQRQANKPPVPAPAHPAAEGTSQHAEPGGKSDPAGSDAAHSQTPAGKPGPAKVHEPAKQAEKAAEGATHDKAPAKPPADYIHKEGTIAEAPTGEGDHEAVASEEGVGSCSGPPCPNIGVEFANELKDHPDLAERNKAVQALRATDLKKAAREGAALIRDLRAVRIRNRAMAAKGQSALTSGDTAPATRKTPTPDQGAGATRKPPGKTIDRPVKTPREARPVVERQPAIDRLTGRPLNPSSARELLHLRLTDMAARNIQPADLGYSENAWKAMERDYEHDPQRALADLESRLDRRDARPHLVEGDALTEEQENQDPESPRHPLDLPEYQDAIDLARERMRTAPQVRTPKTGANAGEVAQSGYRSTKRFPHSEEATERAGQEGREAGHEPEPHEFDRSANAGDSGQVRGSHAEKQAAQLAPNEPVGVSKPMCSDCIIWFRHIAVKRGIPQVVADPVFTRVFMPDGTVHRILNPVRPSAAGQGGNR